MTTISVTVSTGDITFTTWPWTLYLTILWDETGAVKESNDEVSKDNDTKMSQVIKQKKPSTIQEKEVLENSINNGKFNDVTWFTGQLPL